MKHQLSMEAAAAYATLLNEYVDYDERDNFSKDFEKFLDAYDGNSKPDKTQTVENFQREVAEQRTIPKVGEIYRTSCAGKIKIIAVIKDRNGCVVVIQAVTSPQSHLFGAVEFLPLTNFEQMGFTKED